MRRKLLAVLSLGALLLIIGGLIATMNRKDPEHFVNFNISPKGDQIVFSAPDGDLYLVHLKTQRVVQLTDTPLAEANPAFSPGGKMIAYDVITKDQVNSHIHIQSLNGGNVKRLTTGKTYDTGPIFSSDGSEIFFFRAHRYRPYSMGGYVWDDWDICTMKSDGTQLQRITQQKYHAVINHISFNNRSLLFGADSKGDSNGKVFLLNLDNGKPPKALVIGVEADFSPDGKHIAFTLTQGNSFVWNLYVRNVNGTNQVQVTKSGPPEKWNPIFTPDGKRILFLSHSETDGYELWQVDVSGKNLHRIADRSLFDDPLKWKPPSKLAPDK